MGEKARERVKLSIESLGSRDPNSPKESPQTGEVEMLGPEGGYLLATWWQTIIQRCFLSLVHIGLSIWSIKECFDTRIEG